MWRNTEQIPVPLPLSFSIRHGMMRGKTDLHGSWHQCKNSVPHVLGIPSKVDEHVYLVAADRLRCFYISHVVDVYKALTCCLDLLPHQRSFVGRINCIAGYLMNEGQEHTGQARGRNAMPASTFPPSRYFHGLKAIVQILPICNERGASVPLPSPRYASSASVSLCSQRDVPGNQATRILVMHTRMEGSSALSVGSLCH